MMSTEKKVIRTAAGDAFTDFVVEVAALGHYVTAAGESLARQGSQSLARWVVLDAIAARPATVSQIARLRGMARQPVQRIAEALVADGLAVFEPNPRHRRAHLLAPTPEGRHVDFVINLQQKAWADAHGARFGADRLNSLRAAISEIRPLIAMPEPPPGSPRE